MDDEQRYTAASSRDARFDGVFFTAVKTTGIYCRPSCPAITPKRANVVFYPTAAAAQQAGFRACKRCRPDASPGSPEWNIRSDVAGRAMRLIADGVVDRAGVDGLADRLGYSPRQVGRVLTAEVCAGPLALARAQRARTARILVETTALPMGDVAFAAGFSSIRQFNATMLEVYDIPPTALRERAARSGVSVAATRRRVVPEPAGDAGATGVLRLRLPYRPPIDLDRMFGFLAARAIPGVEVASPGEYRRTIRLPNGCGLLSLRHVPSASWVDCSLVLSDLRDVTAAVQRCRRLLDLDADPAAISGFFDEDPLLGPLAAKCPGRRSIGAVDGDEIAVRAVLGQQVSVAAARRLGGRLTALYGTPLPPGLADLGAAEWGLTHVFPDPATIAGLDPGTLPMPLSRARALATLATSLAGGDIRVDAGADREEVEARLLALPGIGPWTAGYIRMRGLSDPDVFLEGDVGVARALRGLAADPGAPVTVPSVTASVVASRWHPWRSYAVHHLWAIEEPPASPAAESRAAS
ncbi:DNA-3-methyladenine glycosylase 2 family protein [Trebonia kvetii]|uniref:DNA-3-methyladenine glycosylase II n=1 Tax=Trebonia kvetii TaxID=2480626 RepID=A0A6P2CBR4_9ACTN|nr:DNA-3-methyladenine glycosylase 2 [Trebonia kvetii]TVZ07381.1 DNA-3-methyladenine glycosylase 2 family protein [Trebonia kvetii]